MKLVKVTPAFARRLLANNHSNRPLSENHAKHLATEMLEGRWALNGDSIRLTSSGELVDGQHRLRAVEISGVTISTYVFTVDDAQVMRTIDTGRRKSAADFLHMRGELYYARISAAMQLVYSYDTDALRRPVRISPAKCIELLDSDAYRDIRRSAQFVPAPPRFLNPSLITACHFIFSRIDGTQADKFILDVVNGEFLAANDPAMQLRSRLIANRENSKGKLPSLDKFALTIKAWNHRRDGATVTFLRWRTGGSAAESFPKAV